MTFPTMDPGASDLFHQMRLRLVDIQNQLRGRRNTGWKPDALRLMNEEIGRMHAAADRMQPTIAESIAPLQASLRAAIAAPSMPSTTQTEQMLAHAAQALAGLSLLAEPESPTGNSAAASEPQDPFRILIVEDDRSQALFAEAILRGAGMQPQVIAQPEQVMAAMDRFDPDLVLMDLHMPGISGTELTQHIRQHPRFEYTPVVFLTGDQDPERQLEVLELGADDYILKPVRPRHLIATVQSRVRRARAIATRAVVAAEPEHHPITGLFTRPALMHKLAEALPASAGGVLLIELGNVAPLRNRYGYAGFESLMNEAGRHLGSLADPHPVARLSDNVFLLLAPVGDEQALAALSRTLRDGIGYRDFHADGETLRLRATVGYASLAHGFTENSAALAAVEDAARIARRDPIGIAAYVPPALPEHCGGLLDDVRAAIAGDGLQLAFQPVVAVAGGDQAQFQVLVRMQDAQGQERTAGEFVPLAEAAGLLPMLDRQVLEQTLEVLKRRRAESRPVRLFLSQSPRTLAQDGYVDELARMLDAGGINGTSLVIDIRLEDALVHGLLLRQACDRLVPAGIQFSLSQYRQSTDADLLLNQLPLGYIRLSADFAQQPLPQDLRDEMREAIDRAHRLGLQVIGQAVEDPQAAATLWMGGIDFIQGNLVQRAEQALDFDFQHATL
jgi:PleD family two-component response regulator/EAL domain-containing protein (putative c-di-GMP-specific phosphodiesterase class I)